MQCVRSERTISAFSRGAELTRAINTMWDENRRTPVTPSRNRIIEERIAALMAEFDLTLPEWHYWARMCARYEA